MAGQERDRNLGNYNMGENNISPDSLEPQGISGAVRATHEKGIATQVMNLPEVGAPKSSLERVLAVKVMQSRRELSPFYVGDDSIGLEDKVAGREDVIKSPETAAEDVAIFFAERTVKMLKVMEIQYGQGFVARAKTIIMSGKLAPDNSPQLGEDKKIMGHLEQTLAVFVAELNTHLTPEAKKFGRDIYEAHSRNNTEEILRNYKSSFEYEKREVLDVVEDMKEAEKRDAWKFARNMVAILTEPAVQRITGPWSRQLNSLVVQ